MKWGDSVIEFEFGKQTGSSPSRESKVCYWPNCQCTLSGQFPYLHHILHCKGQEVDEARRQSRQNSNSGSFSPNLQKNVRRNHRSSGSHGSNSKLESKTIPKVRLTKNKSYNIVSQLVYHLLIGSAALIRRVSRIQS